MKKSKTISDGDIIEGILGSTESRERIFQYIYSYSGWKSQVESIIINNKGTVTDAEDVFQESIILLDRNIRNNIFNHSSMIKTYFMGIVKQHWFNKQKSKKQIIELDEKFNESHESENNYTILELEKKEILDQLISQISKQCNEILSLYKLSFSNEEIANKLNLSSAELAKKYTYRCREKLRELIYSKPEWLEYFKN